MKDPPKKKGGEIYRENIVVLRKRTVIKSKENIFKNYSPSDITEEESLCITFMYNLNGLIFLIDRIQLKT